MPKFCLLISNSNREIILSTPPICKIIRDPSTRSRRNMWKKWRSSTCDKNWSNKSNHRTFDVLSFDWKLDSHESCGIESWLLISSVWPQLSTMMLTIYLLASLHSVLGPEKLNESNCIIVRSIQGVYDGRGQRSCKCNYVHFIKRPVPHAHTACVRPGPHAHTEV